MKQVKFFLVALMAVVMGMSVTSCMGDGENDPTVRTGDVVRANMAGSFTDRNGMKLVPASPSYLTGDMYFVNFQYDSSTITANSTSVDITLLSTPSCIDGESVESVEKEPNVAICGFSTSYIVPYLFDNYTLVIPFYFWTKNVSGTELETEIAKHKFILSYDREALKEGDTELDLYLTDNLDDTDLKREVYTGMYRAYNLRGAIADFENITKTKLTKINLRAKTNSNSNSLTENVTDAKVSLEYKSNKE